MMAANPSRSEVWIIDLNPTIGHEQSGIRPGLVISVDLFNQGPAGLVVLLPITTRDRGIPLHVALDPPDGGLTQRSFIKCEDIRSVSSRRLVRRLGVVSLPKIAEVEDRLRILLDV